MPRYRLPIFQPRCPAQSGYCQHTLTNHLHGQSKTFHVPILLSDDDRRPMTDTLERHSHDYHDYHDYHDCHYRTKRPPARGSKKDDVDLGDKRSRSSSTLNIFKLTWLILILMLMLGEQEAGGSLEAGDVLEEIELDVRW